MLTFNNFFSALSERHRDENALSDLTYCMAKADPVFFFSLTEAMDFRLDPTRPYEIEREITFDDSRPDFIIRQDNWECLIENKINDTNYHFEQYAQRFPGCKKGFISKYRLEVPEEDRCGFACITWDDFLNRLQVKMDNFDDVAKSFVASYITYVKEVCGIVDLKKIKCDGLISLYHFNELIKDVVQTGVKDFDIKIDGSTKTFSNAYSGWRFYFKKNGFKKELYPWIGIDYGHEPCSIYVSLEDRWCATFNNRYKIPQYGGRYFATPYRQEEEKELVFELNQEKMKEFNAAGIEQQRRIMSEFFREVVNEIGTHC